MKKIKIPTTLALPIYIALLAIFGYLVYVITGLLGASYPVEWGFFSAGGILLSIILFVWARQIWWYISGTGDFIGREGLLKRLWDKIFKK